ncbi:hypothetical protein NPIL_51291, partial [Nephila pilipes]
DKGMENQPIEEKKEEIKEKQRMCTKSFETGELVWAKLKNFPFWPGQISEPLPGEDRQNEGMCYMWLLGSRNYLWVPIERVCHHSECFIPTSYKNKSDMYKKAIDEVKIVIEGVRLRDLSKVTEEKAEEKELMKDTQLIEEDKGMENQP